MSANLRAMLARLERLEEGAEQTTIIRRLIDVDCVGARLIGRLIGYHGIDWDGREINVMRNPGESQKELLDRAEKLTAANGQNWKIRVLDEIRDGNCLEEYIQ